ncbi:aromatic-ring hydroxylase C-terminal domain-containing protein [Streptomyces sp. NPDC055506]
MDGTAGGTGPVHDPVQGAYGAGLFLVRPDGYVGWAGDSATGLTEHFARFGRRR